MPQPEANVTCSWITAVLQFCPWMRLTASGDLHWMQRLQASDALLRTRCHNKPGSVLHGLWCISNTSIASLLLPSHDGSSGEFIGCQSYFWHAKSIESGFIVWVQSLRICAETAAILCFGVWWKCSFQVSIVDPSLQSFSLWKLLSMLPHDWQATFASWIVVPSFL